MVLSIKKLSDVLLNRWSRNALFWIFVSFLHYYPRQSLTGYLFILFFVVSMYGLPVYINNLYLIPAFFMKRRYTEYCLLFAGLIAFATMETYAGHHWINMTYPDLNFFSMMKSSPVSTYAIQNVLVLGAMALGKFMNDVLSQERRMEVLQAERLRSELESLKAQLNPHFLFNALNTIYGLARRKDEELACAILTLSEILRNTIYNGQKHEIGILEELHLIEQYISFSRLRSRNKGNIDLLIEADVKEQTIAHLLVLPLIENAIKHGSEHPGNEPAIFIKITLNEKQFLFHCRNARQIVQSVNENAIGLKNVKRRLELCYPERHELSISEDEYYFHVYMKIQLS